MVRFGIAEGFTSKPSKVVPDTAVQSLNRAGLGFCLDMAVFGNNLVIGGIFICAKTVNVKQFELPHEAFACTHITAAKLNTMHFSAITVIG